MCLPMIVRVSALLFIASQLQVKVQSEAHYSGPFNNEQNNCRCLIKSETQALRHALLSHYLHSVTENKQVPKHIHGVHAVFTQIHTVQDILSIIYSRSVAGGRSAILLLSP